MKNVILSPQVVSFLSYVVYTSRRQFLKLNDLIPKNLMKISILANLPKYIYLSPKL